MARLWHLIGEQRGQFLAFGVLFLFVLVITFIADRLNRAAFERFLGNLNPPAVMALLFVTGGVVFTLLLTEGHFAIFRSGNMQGILIALGGAVLLAVVMILVDWRFPYPADINVPWPAAVFFYPAIAYVVEIVFHVLPFGLLYIGLGRLFSGVEEGRIVWICILLVALLEPLFQVGVTSQDASGVLVYLVLHLFVFDVVQLWLFWKYDFVTMYSFRLVYYLIWHVAWGHFRLSLLF